MMLCYTGVGSRNTPKDVQDFMTRCAERLEKEGWTLRSGGADGADSAFEKGVRDDRMKEIFLPWRGFNGRRGIVSGEDPNALPIAIANYKWLDKRTGRVISEGAAAWEKLSSGSKKLQTRNVHQVLGEDLRHPSRFVLCWTPEGKKTGGTGQAIRIAEAYRIKVFDLGLPDVFGRIGWWLHKAENPI